jgi:hypothetical protein
MPFAVAVLNGTGGAAGAQGTPLPSKQVYMFNVLSSARCWNAPFDTAQHDIYTSKKVDCGV